jgi:hypothetical protein
VSSTSLSMGNSLAAPTNIEQEKAATALQAGKKWKRTH